MAARLLWCDDYDHEMVRRRLSSVRAGCDGWEWVRVQDDDPDQAWLDVSRELGITPAFGPQGKVVLCHGEPSFSKELAKQISAWAKGKGQCPVAPDVAFLLVSSPTTALAKAIITAAKARPEMVKLGHTDRMTRANAKEWVDQRARDMGLMLSPGAARLLLQMIGLDPNALTLELRKLKALSPEGGDVAEWAVEQYCVGKGEGFESFAMENAILAGDPRVAFLVMAKQSADVSGAFRMMGSLRSSIRRYCVAIHGDGVPDAGMVGHMVSKDGPMYTVDKLRTTRSMVSRAGRDESWSIAAMRLMGRAALRDARRGVCPLTESRTLAELARQMAEAKEE